MVRFRSTVKTTAAVIALAIDVMGLATHVAGASTRASRDDTTSPRTPIPAFLVARGRYTAFDAPGARLETAPTGINDHGQITGSYVDADGVYHGYLRDRRGRFTDVDLPAPWRPRPAASTTAAKSWAATTSPPRYEGPARSSAAFCSTGAS